MRASVQGGFICPKDHCKKHSGPLISRVKVTNTEVNAEATMEHGCIKMKNGFLEL